MGVLDMSVNRDLGIEGQDVRRDRAGPALMVSDPAHNATLGPFILDNLYTEIMYFLLANRIGAFYRSHFYTSTFDHNTGIQTYIKI